MNYHNGEKGQAVLLVVVVMGIFLIGAVGLAIDVSQLFGQQQMAQVAADAAAQAAMLSIFQGVDTSSSSTTYFPTSAFTCSQYPNSTPCKYALMNGFGTGTDTVAVSFPACPYPTICASDMPNEVQVTITRSVSNTLIRMVGGNAHTNIAATGTAATLSVVSPVPILITDPQKANTLSMNGATSIKICGGPQRSIQINSSNTSGGYQGGGGVDLSGGGPTDPSGTCAGTGSDFGTFGGPATNPGVALGSTGHYLQPASPIPDPLASVPAPVVALAAPASKTIKSPTDGCTSTCTEYSPGLYVGGLNLKNDTVIFKPGLYYMQGGGFTLKKIVGGGSVAFNGLTTGMCFGCAADPSTGTGMVVYDTGPSGSTVGHNPAGGFTMDTNVGIFLQGSTLTTTLNGNTVPAAPYYGILFWEDRTADKNLNHNLGQGNASFAWTGTIYITNTLAIMQDTTDKAYPDHVQAVTYNGGPSGTTIMKGYIIVGRLSMVGNTAFSLYLLPYGYLTVKQVALVGGGPHS